jgi:high-affinity iron transporter
LDFGALTTGLLTGLREGVEAALIISVILSYLARTGNRRHFRPIWLGAVAAIATSVIVGAALWVTIGELHEPAEQIFEATAMLIAAAVVTWMLFWMRRTSATVSADLRAAVDRSLGSGGIWGLAILAFTAVIREGIETSLFLLGQATAASTADLGALSVLAGAVIGLAVAAVLGVGFYRGARAFNLRTFFHWTGIALVFVAAGLVAGAIHELVEIGWIGVGAGAAFDISAVLPSSGGGMGIPGEFLHALLGYSSQPEWAMLATWAAYVGVVLWLYTRPLRPSGIPARQADEASEQASEQTAARP